MVSIPMTGIGSGNIISTAIPALGFVTEPLDDGLWTWTWTKRLGYLLDRAEIAYGPRDPSWTIIGVEFGGDCPMTWYRGFNLRQIIIKLTAKGALSPTIAFSELAHEVIHLLSPGGGDVKANRFEEGLASLFSDKECDAIGSPRASSMASYDTASKMVGALLLNKPTGVLELRRERTSFNDWTPEFMVSVFPDALVGDLEWLCAPFDRDEKYE